MAFCALIAGGCGASDAVVEDEGYGPEETVSAPSPRTSGTQQFKVRADTVTAQTKRRGKTSPAAVELRQTAPKRFFAVQIGAFRSERNVAENLRILAKRFDQPVTSFFDPGVKLTRICVGSFQTKSAALEFLKTIQSKYPKDYAAAWVAEVKQ